MKGTGESFLFFLLIFFFFFHLLSSLQFDAGDLQYACVFWVFDANSFKAYANVSIVMIKTLTLLTDAVKLFYYYLKEFGLTSKQYSLFDEFLLYPILLVLFETFSTQSFSI